MVVDFDDLGLDAASDRQFLARLRELKMLRPDFRCTVFAVPGVPFKWEAVPDWIELAMHGWKHPNPYECCGWDVFHMETTLLAKPDRFVKGWKSPGWQSSDAVFQVLHEDGWWMAVHPDDTHRIPVGLPVHMLNVGPDHWHGHVGNDCGNGLGETWDHVVQLVRDAPSFEFMSEEVRPWQP